MSVEPAIVASGRQAQQRTALRKGRARRDDIPLLVRRFVTEFASLHDREFHGISGDALAVLVEYGWPGNVRELRNLVESMVVLAHGREIGADDIPRAIREGGDGRRLPAASFRAGAEQPARGRAGEHGRAVDGHAAARYGGERGRPARDRRRDL